MWDRLAMVIGLFVVPLIILRGGNRFRDKTTATRRNFWGAILGHSAGLIVAVIAALLPPIAWEGGPFLRDFLVHWSMLIGAMVGVIIARTAPGAESAHEDHTARPG